VASNLRASKVARRRRYHAATCDIAQPGRVKESTSAATHVRSKVKTLGVGRRPRKAARVGEGKSHVTPPLCLENPLTHLGASTDPVTIMTARFPNKLLVAALLLGAVGCSENAGPEDGASGAGGKPGAAGAANGGASVGGSPPPATARAGPARAGPVRAVRARAVRAVPARAAAVAPRTAGIFHLSSRWTTCAN
jgi:hypothetical protein